MKTKIKHLALLLTLVVAVVAAANVSYATDQKIDVYENQQFVKSITFFIGWDEYYIDGKTPGYKMDAKPFIENERTYVPVRYLGNALGVPDSNINWNGNTQTATLTRGDTTLRMTVGVPAVTVNNVTKAIEVGPILLSDPAWRTYLPARFVAEGLGYEVGWDPETRAVICWPKGQPEPDITAVIEYVQEQRQEQEPVKIQEPEPVKPPVLEGDTYVANGYKLPVNTDLDIAKSDPSLHGCELDILIFIKKPLEEQYNTLEAILSQKFDSQTVSEVMNYAKQKTDWKQGLANKDWVSNGKTIRIGSSGGSSEVNIMVWEYVR